MSEQPLKRAGLAQQGSARDFSLGLYLQQLTTGHKLTLTEQDQALIRQAAHRYTVALSDIRNELSTPSADAKLVEAFARDALDELPEQEELILGDAYSIRVCGWMARDRYVALSHILDTAISDGDVLSVARKQVAKSFAKISLRSETPVVILD